jgi:hypothetical protein
MTTKLSNDLKNKPQAQRGVLIALQIVVYFAEVEASKTRRNMGGREAHSKCDLSFFFFHGKPILNISAPFAISSFFMKTKILFDPSVTHTKPQIIALRNHRVMVR